MSATGEVQAGSGDGFESPRHVAIIMDGNGRWAAARGLPRVEGHRRGVEALRKTVRAANELGISILTIFSFSSENWSRPPSEIRDLLGLLRRFIRNDLVDLHKNNIRVRVIGERDDLDPDIRNLLREAEDLTRGNDGFTLVELAIAVVIMVVLMMLAVPSMVRSLPSATFIGPGEGAAPGAGCGNAVERAVWKVRLPSTFCITWWI